MKALQDPTLTLYKILTLSRTLETSKVQAAQIVSEKKSEIAKLDRKPVKKDFKNKRCFHCGESYPHMTGPCPAKGKTCNKCNKMNHYTKCCKSKHVKQINFPNETTELDDYVFTTESIDHKRPTTNIKLCDTKICILVDTGASVNLLDEHTYCDLKSKPKLMISSSKIYSYGGTKPMKILGQFDTLVESVHAFEVIKFHVVEGNCGSLLSYQSAKSLHIIDTINATTCNLKDSHANLFRGIGALKSDPVKLHINNDINPSVQRHRRIPFHVRKKVEDELLRLEKLDIIEKVEGPTPWISPIVVVPKKNDSIRICVDMRLPNKAIERERHITPTIDDIITELNGAQLFSKIDLNNGYHQLVLHEESRYITTFTTHVGLRRYKRLMFGINAASEIFQNAIYQSLHGLSGVINISDDILVYGNCKTSHDENLKAVLTRLEEKGLTLNYNKCEFNTDKISFYGHIFSKDGLSPDPAKINAIKNCSAPNNIDEVRSPLGMTNYVSRFIRDYSTITEPIRRLMKSKTEWQWSDEQEMLHNHIMRSIHLL